jgi:glucuronate isomerase
MMRDTGYPFTYHIELHKCLKQLMQNMLNQKDAKVLKLYCAEVYSWLLKKLM